MLEEMHKFYYADVVYDGDDEYAYPNRINDFLAGAVHFVRMQLRQRFQGILGPTFEEVLHFFGFYYLTHPRCRGLHPTSPRMCKKLTAEHSTGSSCTWGRSCETWSRLLWCKLSSVRSLLRPLATTIGVKWTQQKDSRPLYSRWLSQVGPIVHDPLLPQWESHTVVERCPN